MSDYSSIKSVLESKLINLQKRGQDLLKDKSRSGQGLSKDSEEQVTAMENDEVVDALDNQAISEIKLIEAALDRIEKNQFGICERCEEEIPFARLEVQPTSPYCVECAE